MRTFRLATRSPNCRSFRGFTADWSAISATTACAMSRSVWPPATPPDPLGTPDIVLMVSEELVIFDNLKGHMQLISLVDPAEPGDLSAHHRTARAARPQPARAAADSRHATNQPVEESISSPNSARRLSNRRWRRFATTPGRATSCRWCWPSACQCRFASEPVNLYRALRSLNPSPYMYFMDLDDFQIVSSSPEILAASKMAKSPTARSPAPAGAATRRKKTRRWKRSCWPIRKK